MTQINWQYQVNNRAGGYVVTNTDWNDFAGNFRAFIDQTTGSGTTDNSPLPIGIDLVNDRVYISDPDSTTPEDANHADTTLSVVGTTTLAGNTQQTGTFTVGVDDTGHDVKFFGATAGAYMLWDESNDLLDVENSELRIRQDSGSAILMISTADDDAADEGMIFFRKSRGTHASPTVVQDNHHLGGIQFQGYDGNSYAPAAQILALVDGTVGDGGMPTELVFQVSPDGSENPVTALTIQPDGRSAFRADTDITVFAPDSSSGTGTTPNGVVTLFNHDAGSAGAVDDFTCLDFIGNGTDSAARIGMKYTSGGGELHFGTSNSYAKGITHTGMVIGPTGYVGIGTTAPQRHLDIRGPSDPEIRLQSTDGSDPYLYFGDESDAVRGGIGFDTSENEMHLRGYNNVSRASVTSAGAFKVGSGAGDLQMHGANGVESFRAVTSVVRAANIVNLTTSAAANVYIASSNNSMYMSTSSARYKTDIEDLEDAYADKLLDLRPVWFRSLCKDDPDEYSYYGLVAEEVAKIEPRFVHYGPKADCKCPPEKDDPHHVEHHLEGCLIPTGVQYDRVVGHVINLLKRQDARIKALES